MDEYDFDDIEGGSPVTQKLGVGLTVLLSVFVFALIALIVSYTWSVVGDRHDRCKMNKHEIRQAKNVIEMYEKANGIKEGLAWMGASANSVRSDQNGADSLAEQAMKASQRLSGTIPAKSNFGGRSSPEEALMNEMKRKK